MGAVRAICSDEVVSPALRAGFYNGGAFSREKSGF